MQIKTKISVRKLKMAQQDSFWKIYSTKAKHKKPNKKITACPPAPLLPMQNDPNRTIYNLLIPTLTEIMSW